jgi:DNA gyrase subunit B
MAALIKETGSNTPSYKIKARGNYALELFKNYSVQLDKFQESNITDQESDYVEISPYLQALPVRSVEIIEASSQYVYDFSVQDDENWIGGQGGIVCLNTDADVDGAHIRTLILTFLFRQMPELIDAGYVYFAKPPLYKVKQGKIERYIEKESDLENFILSDKWKDIRIIPQEGKEFYLDSESWKRASNLLKQYKGLLQRLLLDFLQESGLVRSSLDTSLKVGQWLNQQASTHTHKIELLSETQDALIIQKSEIETNHTITQKIPRSLFESKDYQDLIHNHNQLQQILGTPPFQVQLANKNEIAQSYFALKTAIIDLASSGISLQRFKGLGEMNPEQLFETTMDPAKRVLARVSIEDAVDADLVFSMLMGEEVEPRRKFIEDHADEVENLDL